LILVLVDQGKELFTDLRDSTVLPIGVCPHIMEFIRAFHQVFMGVSLMVQGLSLIVAPWRIMEMI